MSSAAVQRSRPCGLTLVELLVTLAILSILAAAAWPYAETAVRRENELELRRALRDMRSAIDRFNDDWRAGRMSKAAEGVSEDGYPRTLDVLVQGVDSGEAQGGKRKYLRRVPRDPMAADRSAAAAEQWVLRGYRDELDALTWNCKDVYDLRSASSAAALDRTHYADW